MDTATDVLASPVGEQQIANGPHVPRACDACRARKIRCDRQSPCSHCVVAKIQCTHAGNNKPREGRTRILLTHQYEKKIDRIERQLDSVICALQSLQSQLRSTTGGPKLPEDTAPISSASSASNAEISGTTDPVIEGGSSLTAQSVFANNFLQRVVTTDSAPAMQERLDDLVHVVEAMQKQPASQEMTYPNAKPIKPVSLDGCELPPIDKTLQVLRLTQLRRDFCLAWVYELFTVNRFPGTIESCLHIYVAESPSIFAFITVNVVLYYLFCAHASEVLETRDEYLGWSKVCAVNVETALASLPLHLPATKQAIIALLLGSFYANEISKPSLAWTLNSKASELCQTLGYHRQRTSHRPDSDIYVEQFLFWLVYVIDKSLALRLGRSSTIQDHDITILPSPESLFSNRTFAGIFNLWIAGAKIQGEIYELLYCPKALTQSEEVRRSHAQHLIQRLEELDTMTRDATERWMQDVRPNIGEDSIQFFRLSDEVLRLSLLTLVHRAIPNPPGSSNTFTPECLRAARDTLARHLDCMEIVKASHATQLFGTYMNWTILFSPFVPFIVLFCHVIETKNSEDLELLRRFISSLQTQSNVSEGIERHRRLFQVLYNVAAHYVKECRDSTSSEERRSSVDFEAYLSALGFSEGTAPNHLAESPAVATSGDRNNGLQHEYHRGLDPVMWMGNGAQLEDWFYSNEQVIALLETPDF